MSRSALQEVRNPVLGLPATASAARMLDAAQREVLMVFLNELSLDARERAEKAWRKSKGPMAAYWKAVSVYARHMATALRRFR